MIDGLRTEAPSEPIVTDYDRRHATLYLRLLDAENAETPGEEIARSLLELDVEADPQGALRMLESHLERARWMTNVGYRQLLAEGERVG